MVAAGMSFQLHGASFDLPLIRGDGRDTPGKDVRMKKAYTSPSLTTFGSVETLTQIILPDCSRIDLTWDHDSF